MKFEIDNPKSVFSHLVLNSSEVAQELVKTPEWKDDETLDVQIQVNGIDINPRIFQKLMEQWRDDIRNKVRNEYGADAFDDKVKTTAMKILQNQSDKVLEVLGDLQAKLYNANDLIKFEWEK